MLARAHAHGHTRQMCVWCKPPTPTWWRVDDDLQSFSSQTLRLLRKSTQSCLICLSPPPPPSLSLSLPVRTCTQGRHTCKCKTCSVFLSFHKALRLDINKDSANRLIKYSKHSKEELAAETLWHKILWIDANPPSKLFCFFFSHWQCGMNFHSIKISSSKVRTYLFCSSCFLTLPPSSCAPVFSLHACLVNSLTSQLKGLPSLANMFLRQKHAALDLPLTNNYTYKETAEGPHFLP